MQDIKFKNEDERQKHPWAGRIPRSLWDNFWGFRHLSFSQSLLDLMKTKDVSSAESIIKKKGLNTEDKIRKTQAWICFTLTHPQTAKDAISFGKDALGLNETSLFVLSCAMGYSKAAERLWETNKDQQQAILKANNFYAFRGACASGHLEIAKWLWRKANKDQQQAMLKVRDLSGDFAAFRKACKNGHLKTAKWLWNTNKNQQQAMLKARDLFGDFAAFREACGNGHLETAKWLWGKASKKRQQAMLKAFHFYAFRGACGKGHLKAAKWLWETNENQQQVMLKAYNLDAFRGACKNGHLKTAEWLWGKARQDQQQAMLKADKFDAFGRACANGHLKTAQWLWDKANKDQQQAMLKAGDFDTFQWTSQNGYLKTAQWLLSHTYPQLLSQAEKHHQLFSYINIVPQFIESHITRLQEKIATHQNQSPDTVFDFKTDDKSSKENKALHTYYCLRYLIRSAGEGADDALINKINLLINIPSVKALIERNTISTELSSTHPQAGEQFSDQSNELLRLANSNQNVDIAHLLLNVPSIREEAERNDFYQGVNGLNLSELAQDHESSMTAMTPQEQKQIADLKKHYGPNPQQLNKVMDDLHQTLKARFLDKSNEELRTITLKGKKHQLPFSYQGMQSFIDKHKLNTKEQKAVNEVYFKNHFHTAFRYLSKPNLWISPSASYTRVDPKNPNKRWADFEGYQPLIATLWLATKDEKMPPSDKKTSTDDRINLFIHQLALIARAHNWDKTRDKYDNKGKPLKDKNGKAIQEEYDDLELDKPSCFSGMKRRLFQGLLDHPLFEPLDINIAKQFAREKIRVFFDAKFKDMSHKELTSIKNAIDNYFIEGELTKPMKALVMDANQILSEFKAKYKAKALPLMKPLKSYIVKPGQKLIFLDFYQETNLNGLLDNHIKQKAPSPQKDTKEKTGKSNESEKLVNAQKSKIEASEPSLKSIKAAVTDACRNYSKFQRKSHKSRLFFAKPNKYSRGEFGLFTRFRHGKSGLDKPEKLLREVNKAQTVSEAVGSVNDLLTKGQYYRHSLASFLLDELKNIDNSPWSDISPDDEDNKYNQGEVTNRLKP